MMSEIAPQLPQNVEAERSILGAILLENRALDLVLEKLKPEDFFHVHHQKLFATMIELAEARQPIDLVTLFDALESKSQSEQAGGIAYISQLLDGVPRIAHVEHYAHIVKQKSILRALVHAAMAMQDSAMEAVEDPQDIIASAEASIFAIADDRSRKGLVPIRQIVNESMGRLELVMSEGKRVSGLPTGYNQLDALTSGLQSSELIILAARPSVGKSALALNIAENAAANGKTVAIFSLEMSKESLLLRLLASQARIDAHKFRTGHLTKQDWQAMTQSLVQIAGTPIWVDDSSNCTVTEIGAKARRLQHTHGLSLLIVDYLQLLGSRGKFSNRSEAVSQMTRSLKILAKDLAVPVLVLSQLTRAPERETRPPQLSDLRESGAIEQDADTVFFIHRPNLFAKKKEVTEEERAQTELIVAKQRNGPVDKVRFVFLGRYTRFEEAAVNSWLWEERSGE